MARKIRGLGIEALRAVLWMLLCLSLAACQTVTFASGRDAGLPLMQPDPQAPIHVLYIGNLCAGCADAHLEQMAAGMHPPRVVEVDSVVIPKY